MEAITGTRGPLVPENPKVLDSRRPPALKNGQRPDPLGDTESCRHFLERVCPLEPSAPPLLSGQTRKPVMSNLARGDAASELVGVRSHGRRRRRLAALGQTKRRMSQTRATCDSHVSGALGRRADHGPASPRIDREPTTLARASPLSQHMPRTGACRLLLRGWPVSVDGASTRPAAAATLAAEEKAR